jgi:hypothetical protein
LTNLLNLPLITCNVDEKQVMVAVAYLHCGKIFKSKKKRHIKDPHRIKLLLISPQ